MIDWVKLVKERDVWVMRNFPPAVGDIPGRDSIIGCIEEFGELAHAHLKLKQGIRGSREDHDAAAKDAIGDMVVYLMGVMSARGVTPSRNYGFVAVRSSEEALLAMRLPIAWLELSDRAVSDVVYYAQRYCEYKGWDFEKIVTSTWDHVKQRDWVKHREAGAVKNDPSMKDPV